MGDFRNKTKNGQWWYKGFINEKKTLVFQKIRQNKAGGSIFFLTF